MVFSEWRDSKDDEELVKSKAYLPQKESDQQVVDKLFDLIKTQFAGSQVYGKKIADFLTNQTPYHFNKRNEIKKLFKKFADESQGHESPRQFDLILYKFPQLE